MQGRTEVPPYSVLMAVLHILSIYGALCLLVFQWLDGKTAADREYPTDNSGIDA